MRDVMKQIITKADRLRCDFLEMEEFKNTLERYRALEARQVKFEERLAAYHGKIITNQKNEQILHSLYKVNLIDDEGKLMNHY